MRNLSVKFPSSKLLAAIFLLCASSAAFAHTGHGVSGLAAGLTHPFSGWDHMLAMVAVGIWAVQSDRINGGRGRKVWLLPATFMTLLAVGAGIGMLWQALPMVETGIAISVLALGLLVSLSMRLPASLSMAITALFGLLHGYAHGLELPDSAAPATYALGFLASTATLHLSGIGLGIMSRNRSARLAQALGIAIAASGMWLLSTS